MKWRKGTDVNETSERLLFLAHGNFYTGLYGNNRYYCDAIDKVFSSNDVDRWVSMRNLPAIVGWKKMNRTIPKSLKDGDLIVAYITQDFGCCYPLILKFDKGKFVVNHSTSKVDKSKIDSWLYLYDVISEFAPPEIKTVKISNADPEMFLVNAIADLSAEYKKSVSSNHIYNPIANALYETWKKYNCEKYCREVNNG